MLLVYYVTRTLLYRDGTEFVHEIIQVVFAGSESKYGYLSIRTWFKVCPIVVCVLLLALVYLGSIFSGCARLMSN